jgi:riboflavin kinase/FMN adenylyltransferase
MSYSISGKVIKGDGYGKKIGFPTLNIDRKNFLTLYKKPRLGVYTGQVILNKKKYKAGIIIGPLDKKSLPKIEAHVIGYKGNAYGKQVILIVDKFIRKFKEFKSEKMLIAQIKQDLEICLQE